MSSPSPGDVAIQTCAVLSLAGVLLMFVGCAVRSSRCLGDQPEAVRGPGEAPGDQAPGDPPEAGGDSCDGHATRATIVQHPAKELAIAIEVPGKGPEGVM